MLKLTWYVRYLLVRYELCCDVLVQSFNTLSRSLATHYTVRVLYMCYICVLIRFTLYMTNSSHMTESPL